jgi:Tol biopolymer transport system component
MKHSKLSLLTQLLLGVTCNISVAQESYFGLTPPGSTPEIFAPGIVSLEGRYEYGISFSPELDEVYFTADIKNQGTSIYFSKIENGRWSTPGRADFTENRMSAEMEPHVTFNGQRIYFTAFDTMGYRIWFVNRLDGTWSKAAELNSPLNNKNVLYPTTAINGDLYYTNLSHLKMYYSTYQDGTYSDSLEAGIAYGLHGFIDPHNNFILLDAPKNNDSSKDRDIYVCFRNQDSSWTKPINLGKEVNTIYNESCPSISPDGKYLFFSRYDEAGGLPNIYWVSSEVLKNLEPE